MENLRQQKKAPSAWKTIEQLVSKHRNGSKLYRETIINNVT